MENPTRAQGRKPDTAKGDLKPPGGRCGYKRKRNSSRCGARSRIGAYYSRTRSEQKASDRCREQRRRRAQKDRRRGKAPCFAEQGKRWEAVSRYWEVGEFPGRKTQHRYGGDRGTTGPRYIEGETGEEKEGPLADRQGVQ